MPIYDLLFQLVYASRSRLDEAALTGQLKEWQADNERDDVTGALTHRADLCLQLLEGPREAVEAVFRRVEKDGRNADLRILGCRSISRRLFPGCPMRIEPAPSWLWTPDQVAAGAVRNATEADGFAVFERLARELAGGCDRGPTCPPAERPS